MGCGSSAHSTFVCKANRGKSFISCLKHFQCCFLMSFLSKHLYVPLFSLGNESPDASHLSFRGIILIQAWYRRYVARLEMRRRCTWRIFQSIEYAGELDHLKLNHFFDYLMTYFTPNNNKDRDFLNRILSEPEITFDPKLEKSVETFETIVVPDTYVGPHLSFPLVPEDATNLLEAYQHEQHLHAYYVLRLLHETEKHLTQLPNITCISTCYGEEITVCDLHGQLSDLFLIFYKNGIPSPQKVYVFNGDFVDRGKSSIEVLIILFVFLLVYPKEVHLNRGNHEDYMINLRYGFNKEVMRKYKEHGSKILKELKTVFSSLPLATLIDQKVLIVHGGISNITDLERIDMIDRFKLLSVLTQKRKLARVGTRDSKASRCGRSSLTSRTQLPHSVVQENVLEERRTFRRMAGMSLTSVTTGSSDSSVLEAEDVQQVTDILWSDPVPQNGCRVNHDRGGGCYFGPDVTKEILEKYNLQFIIRSHECKPEGYEFCHDQKVITVFSASNYYAVGSNRGAILKLGPDLIPHIIQYQASKDAHKLTMTQRISRVEESAYQVLREQLFAHRSELASAFSECEQTSGMITINDWAQVVESVLNLGLPWRMLRPHLVSNAVDGMLDYNLWLKDLVTEQCPASQESLQSGLLENIYRNLSNLETLFNIIDSDHSGFISRDEFYQTFKLFSAHMNIEISDQSMENLINSIDLNKDGNIDFNEFIEAFRLVRQTSSGQIRSWNSPGMDATNPQTGSL
nr:serine/threonine-protein phosphatase with EF-hands 2 isoform X2 [Zootoca vivipara]